jgi:hypothetical protein
MQDRPKWIVSLTEFLIDNFTVLATIGYTSYVIYRREILKATITTDDLITAVLAVLGLLATSEIIERYRKLTSIDRSNKRILSLLESQLTDRPSAIAFFEKLPALDTYIQSANSIDMGGFTLTSAINKQFSNIRERIKEGAIIRLLIADPDSLALQMASLRSEDPDEGIYFRKRLDASLQDIEYLHRFWTEHQAQSSNPTKKGSLFVRLLPYAPSFSVLVFDRAQSYGKVIVEIYAHKTFRETAAFSLTSQRDGNWYEYFANQFEVMWKEAKVWEPRSKSL